MLLCNVAFIIPWSVTVGHGRLHLGDAGLSTTAAAGVLSVMVFMSVMGRLCGGLGDFIKAENLLAWALILEGFGVLGFLFASGPVMAYVSTIAIALGFGASYISLSVVIARFYGKERFAKTVGLIYLGSGCFNAFAPGIAGRIYDKQGSYTMAFASIAFGTIAIGLLALRLRPPTAPVSPCQTLFVTTRARPDFGSRESATFCKSSSPLRWLGGNQLSSNFLSGG